MGGTSKSTSQTSQEQQGQSSTAPWQPTQGILQNILSGIGSQGFAPTSAQTGALNTLQQNAQGVGNYAPQATDLANQLMSGGGTQQNAGMLNSAYQNYQNQLNPIANQNNDPTQNPGMQDILATIRQDVGNQVNGQFAAAGRDMSGLNQQALGRGISQGEAVPLLNQYNQNVQNQMGAAGALYGAGGQTANGLQAFNQQGFTNQGQGLDTAINGIPTAQNNQANQVLQAGQQAYQLPLQNLGMLSNLTIPIAGLGSQNTSSGTSTGQTQGTQQMSGAQQFALIAGGLGSMFRPSGGGGGGGY